MIEDWCPGANTPGAGRAGPGGRNRLETGARLPFGTPEATTAGESVRKSSRTRISEPARKAYPYKKRFYRNAEVAEHYDAERFRGPFRQLRNRRKWAAVQRALAAAQGPLDRLLDLPCGTGRFTAPLAGRSSVVGADISLEMMRVARRAGGARAGVLGFVQADAERLPFPDDAFDCVVSIRFMFHVDPPTRITILRELGRVAPQVVVDYRHRYSYRYAKWRVLRAAGLTRRSLERVSRQSLQAEFRDAGLAVRRIVPVTRVFSDKWIVLAERA